MKYLKLLALLLLVVAGCKKEDEEDKTPIKFLSDVYPNNYTFHTNSNPLKMTYSFTALANLSVANDADSYIFEVSPNADFSNLCKAGGVDVKPSEPRNRTNYVTIFKSNCDAPPILYLRVYRNADKKFSEVRKYNIVWD